MIRLYDFKALGFEPVPWTVPNIGVVTRGGKRIRFSSRNRKSNHAEGRLSMTEWQEFVAASAREAAGSRRPETEPIEITFTFYAVTPPGRRHGELWDVKVEWDKKSKKFIKRAQEGKTVPDLTNLQKAVEDALEGIVYENDVSNRIITSRALYGPQPGVRVVVNRIEPTDFPGFGEPVQ